MKQDSKKLNTIQTQIQKEYLYYTDNRTKQEIQLTTQLARVLSDLNFQDLSSKNQYQIIKNKLVKKEDILYVCLTGVPPFQNQYEYLNLPGDVLEFKLTCFDKGVSDEELKNKQTQLQIETKILHERINSRSLTKPIIFIYHSFGSYILAAYCQLYKNERIIGLISIGGAPIRFNVAAKQTIRSLYGVTLDQLRDRIDTTFKAVNERRLKLGASTYSNKYQVFGINRAAKSQIFKNTCQNLRNLPNVLKCFIYGRKDSIFPENMSSEKAVHYSYKQKFSQEYEAKLKTAYQKVFLKKCDNVQQKFIYSFEAGLHSPHRQKQLRATIIKIIQRYLLLLEEMHSLDTPKL